MASIEVALCWRVLLLATLIHLPVSRGFGISRQVSLRNLLDQLAPQHIDPGKALWASKHVTGSAKAIQSSYDDFAQRLSHKALGTKAARSRAEGLAAACDRGGGKCALCALTRGSFCEEYYRQERVPWKRAPRGSKDCPTTKWGPCNGVGNCHYDIGVCQCPAGWKGAACDQQELRPCTNAHKDSNKPLDLIISHIGPDGMDLDLSAGGWTASRCAGFCDADRASCWCPPNTKHGRQPPPADAPPWVRYSKRGRPIPESCKPGKVQRKDGSWTTNNWGNKELSTEDLWGPKGWCNTDDLSTLPSLVVHACAGWATCQDEGLHGPLCDMVSEETCLNQCSGHGECDAGYCRCHPGWYGHDCARKKAGEEIEPGVERERPWLKSVVVPVPAAAIEPPPAASGGGGGGTRSLLQDAGPLAAVGGELVLLEDAGVAAASRVGGAGGGGGADGGGGVRLLLEDSGRGGVGGGEAGGGQVQVHGQPSSGRLRPLIYIYDMPPELTSRMHQYKHVTKHCGYRAWGVSNQTQLFQDGYSVEVYLHEMLSISHHRTFDPEEADFFYVPVYYTCWMWPVNGWADMPFWGAPTSWHRYSNAAHMWLAAKNWIQTNFPFWNRRGGRDHIWLTNHDEGACYMPTEIFNSSIMLTHWGRTDPVHTSNSAYTPDVYSSGIKWPGVLDGKDVKTLFEGHPCYDPVKDLVIPGFKMPTHYSESPLLGKRPYERDILLYLRGDVGRHRTPGYSRGIRQKLWTLAVKHDWAKQHRIFIGEKMEIQGEYGEHLARSLFCPVVPGDGYSMRFEDAVLHGCLPLIIMDNTHAVFETVVDIDSFSLRIKESAVNEHLPELLKAISTEQIERMQRRLALVWHRFAYAHGPLVHSAVRGVIQQNLDALKAAEERQETVPPSHPYQPVHSFPVHTDALATIMQWLHSRIKYTRAPGESGGAAAAT